MEHQVFVPVAAEPLRRVLADPARLARAVPGLQQDTSRAPVAGRLKVRVGGSSITYRGTLRVVAREDGSHTLDVDAAEVRGSGTVRVALTLRTVPADGGTNLVFGGRVTGTGRFADLDPGAAAAAGRRLLNRFAEGLAQHAAEPGPPGESEQPTAPAPSEPPPRPGHPDEPGRPEETTGAADPAGPAATTHQTHAQDPAAGATGDGDEEGTSGDRARPDAPRATGGGPRADEDSGAGEPPAVGEPGAGGREEAGETGTGGHEGPAGPGAGGPRGTGDREAGDQEVGEGPAAPVPGGLTGPSAGGEDGRIHEVDGVPPAEAAHARRTMIGRSAEEVDHAPPRGRYAPVPAPVSVTAQPALRWAAPAAVAVLASAVVIARALRRRWR